MLLLTFACIWETTAQEQKTAKPAKSETLLQTGVSGLFTQATAFPQNEKATISGNGGCRIQQPGDFNGDGKTDYSIFRASTGTWYIQPNGSGVPYGIQFGASGFYHDYLQPADYDGDGKTDIGVFRQTTGVWYWIRSSDNTIRAYRFGATTQTSEPTDVPVAGDYNGDGKAEIAVYRRTTGVWYVLNTENDAVTAVQWGGDPTDTPALGDFDGDCKIDYGLRRQNSGASRFFILFSGGGSTSLEWGNTVKASIAIGDYNGDGRSDVGAVLTRNLLRYWYVIDLTNNNILINGELFGQTNDIPIPGDYDGDLKTDIACYRYISSIFFYRSSLNNLQNGFAFGTSGDISALEYPVGLPLN